MLIYTWGFQTSWGYGLLLSALPGATIFNCVKSCAIIAKNCVRVCGFQDDGARKAEKIGATISFNPGTQENWKATRDVPTPLRVGTLWEH